jgi:arylsulfatase A-like enzyme
MPAWDSLDENGKRVCARQMEVYAGYSENADHHVGRLLDSIEKMGELDDTIVIWIWGDNGASLEGTPNRFVQRGLDAQRPAADRLRADAAHPEVGWTGGVG